MRSDLSKRFNHDKNIKWTQEEMDLVLAYYIFIYHSDTKKTSYESFTNDLRMLTKNERTTASVGMRLHNYEYVDPSCNGKGFDGGAKPCSEAWGRNINEKGEPKIKLVELFNDFIDKYGKTNPRIYDCFKKLLPYYLEKHPKYTNEIIEIEYNEEIEPKELAEDILFNATDLMKQLSSNYKNYDKKQFKNLIREIINDCKQLENKMKDIK